MTIKPTHLKLLSFSCRSGTGPNSAGDYDIFGAVLTEVEVDLLTGEKVVRRTDIMEDVGNSLSKGEEFFSKLALISFTTCFVIVYTYV